MRHSVTLQPYEGNWPDDDRDAGFRQMVYEYSHLDAISTLKVLSKNKDIPLGAIISFIIGKYASSGSNALMEMGPSVAMQMDALVQAAEDADTPEARLEAYESLKKIISWLKVPLSRPLTPITPSEAD